MEAREVLGVAPDAGDEEIRAAYLRKVKEHPPEQSPEEFERIRDAYEALRDPRRRIREMLFSGDPLAPFPSLVAGQSRRRYAGPEPWLGVLQGK